MNSHVVIALLLALAAGPARGAETAIVATNLSTRTLSTPVASLPDLEYARIDGCSLALDLHLPVAGDGPYPVVVWIHGGGWREGDKSDCKIDWLTAHGYVVASINYRLSGTALFPAQIHDCKGAIRWLRAHAGTYNLDPRRFAVAGDSAGGHLAVLVGTSGQDDYTEGTVGGNESYSSRVQAVIDYYGATDFILRSRTQPQRANEKGSVVYELLGGGADQKPDLARRASGVSYVSPDDPPLLIFHGDQDQTVLPDQSKRIFDAYRSAGLTATLVVVPGAGHGGDPFFSGKNRQQVLQLLNQTLAPPGASRIPPARTTGPIPAEGTVRPVN